MVKKILHIALIIAILAYTMVVLGYVNENRQKEICRDLEIKVLNNDNLQLIRKDDVLGEIENYGVQVKGLPIDKVNTLAIENILNHKAVVKNTIAYTTVEGKLCIEVIQRRPIVKVIDRELQQYFIDEKGEIIPDRLQHVAHVLIANGNIFTPIPITAGRSVFAKNDSVQKRNILSDIYRLARYIDSDDLWRTLFVQLYVNDKHEILLIPRVGNHVIVFGNATDIDEKFIKLKSLYRTFNQIGWNNYKVINLKYNKQIVCIKNN